MTRSLPRRAPVPILALALAAMAACSGEEERGFDAAKEALGKLLPLKLKDGRLALDREAWQKKDAEPLDEEARLKARRERVARRLMIKPEEVTDALLKHFAEGEGGGPAYVGYFRDVMDGGGASQGGSSGSSGSRCEESLNGEWMDGRLEYDTATQFFDLRLIEKTGPKRQLGVIDGPGCGLVIRLVDEGAKHVLVFVQPPWGEASATSIAPERTVTLTGMDFVDLVKKQADQAQVRVLRPLTDLGLRIAPDPYLPPVMAVATSAFSAPAAELAAQVEAQLVKLRSDDNDEREAATLALVRLYPVAIHMLDRALERAEDMEVKLRLQRVAAAHPTIKALKAYVEEKKLQDDETYLLDLFANVPFFKAAARARLAALYGKDYGDDPETWPKQKP
ncbi:MAG: hypothetical protein M5U26_07465 [Planctomycetota bacterium]|nr:hypothetical protein [Planctomycetota bacterium]